VNLDIEKTSVIYHGISFDQIENDITSENYIPKKFVRFSLWGGYIILKG